MYDAAKAHGDRLDLTPDLKIRRFSEAGGADINLGRARMLANRQQFLMLRLGSPRRGLGW
jgi:hypothetical protein